MIRNTEATNMNVLYTVERLSDMLEMMDQLHTAASDGELQTVTRINKRELLAMLNEFVYTAQETISEINQHEYTNSKQPNLHILDKPQAAQPKA